jgi:hypothetical protein
VHPRASSAARTDTAPLTRNATSRSWPHVSHRSLTNPCEKTPQRK